jgi:hypothetical protein
MSCSYLVFQVVCEFPDFLVSYESVQNIRDILLQSPRVSEKTCSAKGTVIWECKGKAIPVTGRGGP